MGGKRPRQSQDVSVLPDGAGAVSVAERHTRGTGVYASQRHTGSNLADLGRRRRAPVPPSSGGWGTPRTFRWAEGRLR